MTRPARVVIDLEAVRSNLQTVKRYAPDQKIMAIIKADAYGHGLERIAKQLNEADAFGVACLEEAVRLRNAGFTKPIILLEGFFSAEELNQLSDLDIQTVIHQMNQLEMVEKLPTEKAVNVWLKIDTGMHRLGFDLDLVRSVYTRLSQVRGVKDEIRLMTHFASAQERDPVSVEIQLKNFLEVIADLEGEHCLANSSAIMEWPASHGDWVRPGLMLYGVSPFSNQTAENLGLKPVMSLQSELISVKQAKKGEKVGYGATWECP